MSALTLNNGGCYVLTLHGQHVIAGVVNVTETAGVQEVVVDVPHVADHPGFIAIFTADAVTDARPCTAEEARVVTAGLRKAPLSSSQLADQRAAPPPPWHAFSP